MRQAVQTLLVLIVSEDTEQIKEEVDEVEVEAQRTKQSELLHVLACIGCLHTHLLDLLRVVSGESDEDEYTYVAQDIVEACAATNMLTTVAITRPIKAINNSLPSDVRSVFVV